MAIDKAADTFTRTEVRRILKITENRLRSWEWLGLYVPSDGYQFVDLIALKTLQKLRENHIPNHRIKASLASLAEKLAEIERPLWELRIISDGRKVAVELPGGKMEAMTGQMLFNFDAASLQSVTALEKDAGRSAAEKLSEAEYWFQQGLKLEEAGESPSRATETYKRALELNPKAAGAWVNIGTIYYRQGSIEQAEYCYRQALGIWPDYALAHFNLGNVCEELGKLNDAARYYVSALQNQSGYADAHYNLALVYERMDQLMPAAKQWKAYLGIDSTSPWAGIAREQLKRLLKITPGGRLTSSSKKRKSR